MNAHPRMSAKGQVVIPKDVRDRYRFDAGERLDVIERPDGVLIRKLPKKSGETFDEITARIRALIRYDGPPVSIEDMNDTIAEMWAMSAQQSDRARD